MTRHLLDSDAVIDLLYSLGDAIALVQGLYDRGDSLYTCEIVWAEVFAGLHPY